MKMKNITFLMLSVLFVLFSNCSKENSKTSLDITFINAQGPVEGVYVFLDSKNSYELQITDSEGKVHFEGFSPKNNWNYDKSVLLKFEFNGSQTIEIPIKEGEQKHIFKRINY